MRIIVVWRHNWLNLLVHKAEAVAFLTRFAEKFSVKEPKENFSVLTWTALDVGGQCVEAFGMTSEYSSPLGQGRLVT
jgi:hypothetical protein